MLKTFNKMKRFIYFLLGLGLTLALLSCEKEQGYAPPNCKCGRLQDQRSFYVDTFNLRIMYEQDYKNNCSNNIKTVREIRYTGTGTPENWGDRTYCDKAW